MNPKPMLFVDDCNAETRKFDRLLDERMRAYQQVDVSASDLIQDGAALGRGCSAGQETNDGAARDAREQIPRLFRPERPVEQLCNGEVVLLGQDLGGRHERGLTAALDRDEA